MKKISFIVLALLLSIMQNVWAEAYQYYIVERVDQTIYFKGTNTPPDNTKSQFLITHEDNGEPVWAKGGGTVWPTVTTIVFEPSFAEARPTSTKMWFSQKPNLTTIIGMQQFLNTSEVTDMNLMFFGCSSLTELDLTGFNTAKVTNMKQMFDGCSNLTTIAVGTGWTTNSLPESTWINDPSYNMFNECTKLIGEDGTEYSHSNDNDVNRTKAHYSEGGYLTSESKFWDGHALPSGFIDTNGQTITIHNIGEMKLLAQNVNNETATTYSGYTFLLARDLVYDINTANRYTPIGNSNSKYFAGTFDGKNHTISGINMSGNGRQGLFGTIAGATIKNLTLSASTFNMTNNSAAGGIVAYITRGERATTVENCHVTSDVSISTQGVAGGIAGEVWSGSTDIRGCTSAATIELSNNNQQVGGIVGHCGYTGTHLEDASYVTVSNCLYYGTSLCAEANYSGYIGGIFGGYYQNENYQRYSVVNFSDNYYTYPDASVKGVGLEEIKSGEGTAKKYDIDLTAGSAAVRAHVVSTTDDIEDMGTAGTPVVGGITPYTYGIKFGDAYYSHVLALDNAGDYTTALQAYDGQTFNVKLRGRTLYKDGSWNTICLPFNLTYFTNTIFLGDDCEVRKMNTSTTYFIAGDNGNGNTFKTGCNDGRLYLFFEKIINNMEAGTPYIVKWTRAIDYDEINPTAFDHVNPMFTNVTINGSEPSAVKSTDETVSFVPTYEPFYRDYADRSVIFVGAANTLYYPNGAGSVSVKSFRAYFQLNGVLMPAESSGNEDDDDDDDYIPVGPGNVKPFILNIEDDATPIQTPRISNQGEDEDFVYDLSGRKIANGNSAKNKLPSGIYIHNGRKEVIK